LIATGHFLRPIGARSMSALGQKQTSSVTSAKSASRLQADIRELTSPRPLSANSVLTHHSDMASPAEEQVCCGAIFQTGTLYFT